MSFPREGDWFLPPAVHIRMSIAQYSSRHTYTQYVYRPFLKHQGCFKHENNRRRAKANLTSMYKCVYTTQTKNGRSYCNWPRPPSECGAPYATSGNSWASTRQTSWDRPGTSRRSALMPSSHGMSIQFHLCLGTVWHCQWSCPSPA